MYVDRGRTHPSCCIGASLQQFLYPVQRGVAKIKIPTLVSCHGLVPYRGNQRTLPYVCVLPWEYTGTKRFLHMAMEMCCIHRVFLYTQLRIFRSILVLCLNQKIYIPTFLFWVVAQRVAVIPYRSFGIKLLVSYLVNGTDRLCRNGGKELPLYAA